MHREWAGHMSVVYLLHQLVENYASNMDLFENVDWVIVPVVNPDGEHEAPLNSRHLIRMLSGFVWTFEGVSRNRGLRVEKFTL